MGLRCHTAAGIGSSSSALAGRVDGGGSDGNSSDAPIRLNLGLLFGPATALSMILNVITSVLFSGHFSSKSACTTTLRHGDVSNMHKLLAGILAWKSHEVRSFGGILRQGLGTAITCAR